MFNRIGFIQHLIFSTAPPDSQLPLLELNCLVLGESHNEVFPVEIAPTKSVGSLKEVIKQKTIRLFNHIDAKDLRLWKVSEVVDDNLENNLETANLPGQRTLSTIDKLSQVFDLPVGDHLHIVVGRPAGGELCCFLVDDFFPFVFPQS